MHLANTASLLTAYLDGAQSAPLPEPVVSQLHLVSGMLLQFSGCQGQALGRSLARMVVARRQLWLYQARIPDADKSALLDALISPGHTFWPVVEEILQRFHRKSEASRNKNCWKQENPLLRLKCTWQPYLHAISLLTWCPERRPFPGDPFFEGRSAVTST
ncbi:UNVERIFIED_CONTAM: hypothetical protein FKN15_038851 [Acipenser sinensis]